MLPMPVPMMRTRTQRIEFVPVHSLAAADQPELAQHIARKLSCHGFWQAVAISREGGGTFDALGRRHRPRLRCGRLPTQRRTALAHGPATGRCGAEPEAAESARCREIRLLKPLVNWKHVLATISRMREHGSQLGFAIPAEEEAHAWFTFTSQEEEIQAGMMERFRVSSHYDFHLEEEVRCRPPRMIAGLYRYVRDGKVSDR